MQSAVVRSWARVAVRLTIIGVLAIDGVLAVTGVRVTKEVNKGTQF
jgi:hypothetical protein